MLAIIADENAAEHRRDEMARAAAAFVHPKLSAVASVDGANGAGHIQTINIIAIPRGCQFDSVSGLIKYGDDLEAPPPVFTPLLPTPDVVPAVDTDLCPQQPEPPAQPQPEPLEVYEPESDDKLAILDVWRRKKTDE
jgi:hypothetical protein